MDRPNEWNLRTETVARIGHEHGLEVRLHEDGFGASMYWPDELFFGSLRWAEDVNVDGVKQATEDLVRSMAKKTGRELSR